MKLPRYAAPGALGISVAALWALWPLLRPAFAPAPGTTLVVVFDGYHRLDAALERTSGPLLLLSCPRTGQPTAAQIRRAGSRPLFIDRSGQNSARQLTALADWLARPPTALPPFGRVLLVSDSHHIPRLLPAAHLALGSQGLAVSGLLANAHLPSSHRLAPPRALAHHPRLAPPSALARHRLHWRLPPSRVPQPQATAMWLITARSGCAGDSDLLVLYQAEPMHR